MPQVGLAIGAAASWLASPGVGALVGRLLLSTAVSAISSAIQKQLTKPQQRGIRTEITTDGGDKPMRFVLGWYATDGHMVCPPMSHGKFDDWSNAYLTYVIDLGNVPGAQIDKVIIDDTEVEFEAAAQSMPQRGPFLPHMPAWMYERYGVNPANPNAGSPAIPIITPGRPVLGDKYKDKIWLRYHDGTETVADPYLLQVYGAGTKWAEKSGRPWTADMVGIGTCYAVLTFRYSTKSFNGLPRCRFVMRGTPLYDPRQDSSAGGSGAQRWDQPATWTTTTNGMVIAYNILRGIPIQGGPMWGYGVSADALPRAEWVAAMTAADQVVDGAPRWQAAWEVATSDEPASVLDEVLKVCCAKVAESGGVWRVRAGPPAAPVMVVSSDDIIIDEDITSTPFPGLEATYNGIHASYPEPAQLWRPKDAPPRYNAAWEASDQGRRLVAELQMPACPWGLQVQRVMRAYIEEERRFRRHSFTLPPEAEALEPLDTIAVTWPEMGYEAKLFEIEEIGEDPQTLRVTAAVIEVDPSDYDWRPGFVIPSPISPIARPEPSPVVPQHFTAEGITLPGANGRGGRPAARLRWGGWALDGITAVRWELRRAGQIEAARGVVADPEAGETLVTAGVLSATDYEARISFLAEDGRAVEWTLWAPFTTPDVRLSKEDLDREVLEDLDRQTDWMDSTGPLLRDLRDEIAGIRDGIAEIDWGNFTVHQQVRREATAEVEAARAQFTEEINVAVSETEAVATRVTELTATVGQNTAAITQEQIARADADGALAADVQTVRATAAGNSAAITQERLARVSADEALAADITSVQTSLGTKASASAVQALTTRVSDTEAGLVAQSDAITQVTARTNRGTASGLLRVSAAGTPAGTQARIGLRAEASSGDTSHSAALFLEANSDGTSAATVVADRFAIVQDTGATAERSVPFVVSGGKVYIDSAFIRQLSIETGHMADGAFSTFWSVNGAGLTLTVSYAARLTILTNVRVAGINNGYSSTYRITRNGAAVDTGSYSVGPYSWMLTNFKTIDVAAGTYTIGHEYDGDPAQYSQFRLTILGLYK